MSIIDRIRALFGAKPSGSDSTAVIGGSVAATSRDDSRDDTDSRSSSDSLAGAESAGGGDSGGAGAGGDGGGGSGRSSG